VSPNIPAEYNEDALMLELFNGTFSTLEIEKYIVARMCHGNYKTGFGLTTGFIGSLFGYTQLQLSLYGLSQSHN
jgi:hypothetical protein